MLRYLPSELQKGGLRMRSRHEREPLHLPLPWWDRWRTVDPVEQIRAGKGFLVEAPAGFGKSWLLKKVILPELGGQPVAVLAPTHTAARKVGGITVHSFIHRHVFLKPFKGWIIIDEYSMLSPDLCSALEHLRDCKFILLGDRLQLEPVVNAWRGQPCRFLWESSLLGIWTDWARVELTTYRRSTDQSHAQLVHGREAPAPRGVGPGRPGALPVTDRPVDWSLCVSNAQAPAHQPGSASGSSPPAGATLTRLCLEGEAVDVFPGTRLVACLTHKQLVNGAILEFKRPCKGGFLLYDLDAKVEFVVEPAAGREGPAAGLGHHHLRLPERHHRRQGAGLRPAQPPLHAGPAVRGRLAGL